MSAAGDAALMHLDRQHVVPRQKRVRRDGERENVRHVERHKAKVVAEMAPVGML
jgi:hypothetical protein